MIHKIYIPVVMILLLAIFVLLLMISKIYHRLKCVEDQVKDLDTYMNVLDRSQTNCQYEWSYLHEELQDLSCRISGMEKAMSDCKMESKQGSDIIEEEEHKVSCSSGSKSQSQGVNLCNVPVVDSIETKDISKA